MELLYLNVLFNYVDNSTLNGTMSTAVNLEYTADRKILKLSMKLCVSD